MTPEPAGGWSEFRGQFPVLEQCVYLNAGTEGPIPTVAVEALKQRVDHDSRAGRIGPEYIDGVLELAQQARAAYARVLGAATREVALTDSTTSGINTVLGGLTLEPGDEIVTSEHEHPGLLAPLRRLVVRYGVKVRTAPLSELVREVGERTRLIACSHVTWVSGEVADVPALLASGVPVLLDGAQALGAIPVNVTQLGVDYYAASGQKWLCGPEGSGALYVRRDRLAGLEPPWPGYGALSDPNAGLNSGLVGDSRRLDTGFPVVQRSAWALAAIELLEFYGWDWVFGRASFMAGVLAIGLQERGLSVASRGAPP
ncbi:MAG: aminotransferase class V-fold PLP-dependent enzyme, partial [Solirubrobacterales bacterium]|nr:aminotransferase class V-fold PLP-dependent enzyme [Solirubrobacterales bacterium]